MDARPTPLTDALDFSKPDQIFLLCKRLERDRERLREALTQLVGQYGFDHPYLKKVRDSAIATLASLEAE